MMTPAKARIIAIIIITTAVFFSARYIFLRLILFALLKRPMIMSDPVANRAEYGGEYCRPTSKKSSKSSGTMNCHPSINVSLIPGNSLREIPRMPLLAASRSTMRNTARK